MEGLYSGQCIHFEVPQRWLSCGPHQAKPELAYDDSWRTTRLRKITNLSTAAVRKESVTTKGKPKPKPKRNSTAKPPPNPKPKLKPKSEQNLKSPQKSHKKDSRPGK